MRCQSVVCGSGTRYGNVDVQTGAFKKVESSLADRIVLEVRCLAVFLLVMDNGKGELCTKKNTIDVPVFV